MVVRTIARIAFLGTCVAMMLGACGASDSGVSPEQACDDTSAALCERFYACYRSDELATVGLPASEAACVTMLQASRGCAAQTTQNVCTGNATYHADEAAKCSDQITGLACSQIRDPYFDTNTSAPACAKACSID